MASVQVFNDGYPDFSSYLRATYEGVVRAVGADTALVLDFGASRLSQAIRRASDRSEDPFMPGKAAERWLLANLGQLDDPIRRAAVAALALGLKPDGRSLPGPILALYPQMHARLARFLEGAHGYDPELFAKDVGLATAIAVPAGALTVAVPTPGAPRLNASRLRRAAAGFRRQWKQYGPDEGARWLKAWALDPWVELHVDTRNLREFNVEGFHRCYHRLAALLALRPDLAGVHGASWLYQPELSQISPNLAFIRETAEAGGGRLVRLRADPVQTAFAVARSPTRRRLFMSGEYRPVCYGMFWGRHDLMAWSRSTLARSSPT